MLNFYVSIVKIYFDLIQYLTENILSQLQKLRTARCYHKCTLVFIKGVSYFCLILTKFGICRQKRSKMPNTKLQENSSGRSRPAPLACGQTDGWNEMARPTVAFRNSCTNARNKNAAFMSRNEHFGAKNFESEFQYFTHTNTMRNVRNAHKTSVV